MGTLATININLKKLDQSKIVTGKNGDKYYNLNLSINENSDNYGNNISVMEPQTEEERKAGKPKTYYGNGKVFWTDGKIAVAKKNEIQKQHEANQNNTAAAGMDDLPL